MPDNFESCEYSERLLNKLISLNTLAHNTVDLSEIKKAIYWAKKYHGDQKRKSGEPFYSHPLEVAYMFSEYTALERQQYFKTNLIITAILHDTIEDTELTQEMIKSLFGAQVANQVEDLTRIKKGHKISSAEMVELLWYQKKYDLLLIKQFDRLHNMLTIGVKSPEKIKKIVEETLNTFISLAIFLQTPELEKQLTQLCYHYLSIKSAILQKQHIFSFESSFQRLSLIFQSNATPI